MAIHSRLRGPRSSGGGQSARASHAAKPNALLPPHSLPSPTNIHHTTANPREIARDDEDGLDEGQGGRATKRRKLSIRSKQEQFHQQQKAPPLDASFATSPSAATKPPMRVTVSQPGGQLIERVNGVSRLLDTHEDELSPPASGTTTPQQLPRHLPQRRVEDKRTLRSQDDGPRVKSELAVYFPNYEDIILDAPRESEFITADSALYIIDDPARNPEHSPEQKGGKYARASPSHSRKTSANGVLSNQFNGSPSLNLDAIIRNLPDHPDDPLGDEHFLKSHRRAERKEKQLRNIEKERAMHEKVQLDRMLEGLQGHDWLKVLGITGITDGEAKKYESKRDYFIAEVRALVDKFKEWKEAERRQKLGKETLAISVRAESEDHDDSDNTSIGPPSSDLNASAARQLQQETVIALKKSLSTTTTPKGKEPLASLTPDNQSRPPPLSALAPPSPEEPFTSFYAKRHLRDAALGKARSGRHVLAFGHPVPEVEAGDFVLPDDYVTEDAIRANARERRRRKRESAAA